MPKIHTFLTITVPDGTEVEYTKFKHNDGTLVITLPLIKHFDRSDYFRITLYQQSIDDLMAVGQIVDIIRRNTRVSPEILLELVSPAYMRYDRVMLDDRTDAFVLNVFAKMLKVTGVTRVATLDAHSTMLSSLMNIGTIRCYDNNQFGALKEVMTAKFGETRSIISSGKPEHYGIILPDAGAKKKWNAGGYLAACTKSRDPATGRLSKFDIDGKDLYRILESKAERLLIVDDICENGGTFLGCAQMLREKGIDKPIDLYITHGVFPKIEAMAALGSVFGNIFIHSCKVNTYNDLKTFCKTNIFALNIYTEH